ncbi:DUF3304 domain-containing protein [Ectopseudomonas hydrolytica]|jgi:hypothetical protein|uniref:DUF3304 domain-containing protein n=1 Tax=Ectopseudomonas hydrolytica TaxID=2493633 RepID=UPI0018A75C34|nr:DUF3304 domain-containing protein [Pseudomonas hydrolytica]MBF8159715.1 DUF3304 domain-containing protein [Pseudomonas mendocina]UTH32517.1 DUF3304 domain-containing protein [Pseudomonas hydrolytica]UZZ11707.1 DUF3304 domain-containing protein [Pseudomonas mendocina]
MKWAPSSPRKSLIGLLLVGTLLLVYMTRAYQQMPGVILYVHNHTDRPIFSYAVNEAWGGNASAFGGGGAACCSRIEGDVLTAQWIKGRTGEQVRQGVEKETITRQVPNPPRTRQDKYLHVHFFPGDQVRLFWSATPGSPYEKLKEAPEQEVADEPH